MALPPKIDWFDTKKTAPSAQIHKIPILPPMDIEDLPRLEAPKVPGESQGAKRRKREQTPGVEVIDLTENDVCTLPQRKIQRVHTQKVKNKWQKLREDYLEQAKWIDFDTGEEWDSDEQEYKIQAILDCRCRGGNMEYLIKWKGFTMLESTWVPRDNLLDYEDLYAFEQLVATGIIPVLSHDFRNIKY